MKIQNKFQKTIFIILCCWCMLPVFACIKELYTGATVTGELLLNFYQTMACQNIFLFIGLFTLLSGLLYLLKQASGLTFSLAKIKLYFKNNIWMLFYVLFLLWSTVSALNAPALIDAFAGDRYRNMGLYTYIIFTCIMLFALFIKDEKFGFYIMYLFLAVSDFVAIIMLIQERDIPLFNASFGMFRSSVFVHFNHFGYYLNLATICASGIFIYADKKSRGVQAFSFLSLLLLFYTLLINNTMGGILSSLITSIVILWFFYLRNRRIGPQQLLPIIAIVILVTLSFTGHLPSSSGENMSDNFFNLYNDANKLARNEDIDSIGTNRFLLWRYYGKMIPEHPFLGLGPDQTPPGHENVSFSDRPANEYLYYAVFHGIPSLIFYLGFLVCLAVYSFKNIKKLSPSAMIAAGCVITYCISAFFGNVVYYTACYLFLFLGFLIPGNRKTD